MHSISTSVAPSSVTLSSSKQKRPGRHHTRCFTRCLSASQGVVCHSSMRCYISTIKACKLCITGRQWILNTPHRQAGDTQYSTILVNGSLTVSLAHNNSGQHCCDNLAVGSKNKTPAKPCWPAYSASVLIGCLSSQSLLLQIYYHRL
jgi:hypothetical protein